MHLIVVRCIFVLVAAGLGVRLIQSELLPEDPAWIPMLAFGSVMLLSFVVIGLDAAFRRKQLDMISAVYFGMIVGLFLTYVVRLALIPVLPEGSESAAWTPQLLAIIGMVLCYLCISVLMQTKDDFRFVIPYVEFSKEVKGIRPYILDTSVVIDGRITDLVDADLFDAHLIMPRFVIAELQNIADSNDKMRRSRGRRGLDVLNKLRNNPRVDLQIHDRELPEFEGQPVDAKLVLLAKELNGKVVTNDYNLNKVARLHGVGVLNLNDIANALKPAFLPGEQIKVHVVKQGEESGQGVGYLDDGTMVVIEGGRESIGQTTGIVVTSVLQTSAGRMVFGRADDLASEA